MYRIFIDYFDQNELIYIGLWICLGILKKH